MTTALGIVLPLQKGNTGFFNQAFDIRSQVKSNLVNLLLTRKGERIFRPDYGCDIYSFIFEEMTDDVLSNIRGTIESSVKKWQPYVNIQNVQTSKNDDTNTITVQISYSISILPGMFDTISLQF